MSKPNTEELLLQSLANIYPGDATAPGVTLGYIRPHGGKPECYYGSICRYEGRLGEGRLVLYKSTQSTVKAVIKDLAQQWLTATQPVRDLQAAVIRRNVRRLQPLKRRKGKNNGS
jgi:hypothetical protein